MFHLNSLSTRIPLAMVGGLLYGLLAYRVLTALESPPHIALLSGFFLFLFYLGSRLLILFSGIRSAYYSKTQETGSPYTNEDTLFFQTVQWVGRFYHYHDNALFIVLMAMSLLFLGSLGVDGLVGERLGKTFSHLIASLAP